MISFIKKYLNTKIMRNVDMLYYIYINIICRQLFVAILNIRKLHDIYLQCIIYTVHCTLYTDIR